jgi:hypothetical protein
MKWPAREGVLLLGGILFAFLVWIPVVINVLPQLVGKEPGPWRWGFEHVPEFFGSQGADHAAASWLVALLPYVVLQLSRFIAWSVQTFRSKRDVPQNAGEGRQP